ncbi:uracil phosphoribosyltransferase [Rheinheimera sp. SA_1]|jgi:uracil phosphoribosyltransferase|uniref:uracil phosphoribosyltransferase n=1 Tax=Rheinheimera sp. SA_1 TaxID=1827365 RepID=UPI0007FF74C2|nr:uracil phosphoribosyltransferase [Rheinheimera sp. SA_1]OBP14793.1 uracil phosphoribosyltransferase [Rheinheimera sp. SA_1]
MNIFQLQQQLSIAQTILRQLRDPQIQQDRWRFRQNLQRLGALLAYEVSKQLPYQQTTLQTGLGTATVANLEQQPVLICVMRAGLPFYEGFLQMFDQADSGFVGAYRQEGANASELDIFLGYSAAPEIAGRDLILIDPMLATGSSLLKVWELLKRHGEPRSLHIAAAIAAPEGLALLQQQLDFPVSFWLGAVDQCLNEQAYIVPGLGDAGDLCYGRKE